MSSFLMFTFWLDYIVISAGLAMNFIRVFSQRYRQYKRTLTTIGETL